MAVPTASIDATLAAAVDSSTATDEILLAATNHDLDALTKLFRTNDAKCQDPDTGFSPLHAAVAACEPDHGLADDSDITGEGDAINTSALTETSALETVRLLFENGAIWNELDNNDETPGCVALRLGLADVYNSIVDAGVRAELLFARLDDYELLPDIDADVDTIDDADDPDDAIVGFEPNPERNLPRERDPNSVNEFEGFEPSPNPSYKIEEEQKPAPPPAGENGVAVTDGQTITAPALDGTATDIATTSPNGANGANGANGIYSEDPLTIPPENETSEPILANPNVNSVDYLRSNLTYSGDRLLDSDKNAVMMDWETEIMKVSADKLCSKPGLRTMNVGFGMGIVDSMFLANNPVQHHIVEAHPQVIERMREKGWFEKPNVRIHQGKWQDVLPKLVEEGVVLDAMYYDTYAEDYKDLKQFFDEYVIALLDSEGLFGFYNGLGADRQVCYDVYKKVVELHLDEAGLDVEWTPIEVPDLASRGEWEGVRYPYWANIKTYWLPTCGFIG